MNKDFKGQTWMITGISSGIGYELARQLMLGGNRVIGFLRNKEKAQSLLEAYPNLLVLYEVDMCNLEKVDKMVKSACEEVGTVNVVVSNAGISLKGFAEDVDIAEMQDVINTNLLGAMVYIRASIPYLKKSGGTLIQISSVNGEVPVAEWSCYCASKYGINGYCESIAKELKPYGVSVIIVEPGNVNTELWNKVADRSIEYNGLRQRSVKSDIDVKKLAGKIISISLLNNPPECVAMGSRASQDIINQIERKRDIYMAYHQLSKEVDADFKMTQQPVIRMPEMADGRDILMWSLGKEGMRLLKRYNWSEIENRLVGFIDAAPDKKGKYCLGRKIFQYDEIALQIPSHYVIVATTAYYSEIKEILEKMGLVQDRDFCYWKDLKED